MPPPLPPEILDLIVDFLHDEPGALKACCLASKSLAHRARKYLFAHVEFSSESRVKLWKKTFADPSNSPARYTRSLSIRGSWFSTSVGRSMGWIRAFSGIVRLQVDVRERDGAREVSFVSLRGLSPTLKSISLVYGTSVTSSEIFDLVCSFSLLEDLTLVSRERNNEDGRWNIPSTSPKLTGCLDLKIVGGIRPAVRRLLELPSGLHFSKIAVTYFSKDVEPAMDLISKCSDTLESLSICYCNMAPVGTRQPDLSNLKRLKEVFWMSGPSVQWITVTLQTVESTNLSQIIIRFSIILWASVEQPFHREWRDLDRLLLQFWISHSIRPRIEYGREEVEHGLRELGPRLLPELTSRGIVDLVEYEGY